MRPKSATNASRVRTFTNDFVGASSPYSLERCSDQPRVADRDSTRVLGLTQNAKAERAVAGKTPVKRNRFVTLTGAEKTVNRRLETKARALAGWKGYTTNLTEQGAPSRVPSS